MTGQGAVGIVAVTMFAAPTLPEALARLHSVFEAVPAPASLSYCDHCVTDEAIAALLAHRPRSTIPAELIQPYLSNLVVHTAGSPADARYFAPRFLELLATGGLTWPDLPSVARYLASAMADWPSQEREAVGDLVRSLWRECLGSPAMGPRPDAAEVLNAAGHLDGDVSPLLELWLATLWDREAAGHLAILLQHDAWEQNGRWQLQGVCRDGIEEQFDAWLRGPALWASVEDRFDSTPEDQDATVLWATLMPGPNAERPGP